MTTKPVTPIRRSASGRPGSAGYTEAVSTSMELLPPEPSSSGIFGDSSAVRDSRPRVSSALTSKPPSSPVPLSRKTLSSTRQSAEVAKSLPRLASHPVVLSSTRPAEPVPLKQLVPPPYAASPPTSRPTSAGPSSTTTTTSTSIINNRKSSPSSAPPPAHDTVVQRKPSSEVPCTSTKTTHVLPSTSAQAHHQLEPNYALNKSSDNNPLIETILDVHGGLPEAEPSSDSGSVLRGSCTSWVLQSEQSATTVLQQTPPLSPALTHGAVLFESNRPEVPNRVKGAGDLQLPLGSHHAAQRYTPVRESSPAISLSQLSETDAFGSMHEGEGPECNGGNADEEGSQPPNTPGGAESVASGRVPGGGTFFTAVNRDFCVEGPPSVSASSVISSMSHYLNQEPSSAMYIERGLEDAAEDSIIMNPMQSPSGSSIGEPDEDPERADYFNAYDDDGGSIAGAGTYMSEYSNPMMTPRASVSRESMMAVFKGLYNEDGEEDPGGEDPAGPAAVDPANSQDAEDVDETRSSMRDLDQMLEEQRQRRSELGAYMEHLKELRDDEGGQLVDLDRNYLAVVEGLIRKQRGESAVLKGWLGPTRFEDLPINQLSDHKDPSVQEGLVKIKELDDKLQEKTMEALIVDRETFPEKWMEEERRRMERHAARVEEALKKQRMKRMRAGRLSRAVTASSNDGIRPESSTTSAMSAAVSLTEQPSFRFYQLRPEEEALVEAVLAREEAEEVNPFEISFALAEEEESTQAGPALPPLHRLSSNGVSTPQLQFPRLSSSGAEVEEVSMVDDASIAEGSSRPATAVSIIGSVAGFKVASQEAARPMSLASINARLDQYALEHEWTSDGGLADFGVVLQQPAARCSTTGREPSSTAPSAGPAGRPTSPQSARSRPALPTGGSNSQPTPPAAAAPRSEAGSTMMGNGKRDYLREQRQAKELAEREEELDAKLRAFKTSDPKVRLTSDQLHLLVEECLRLEDMHQQRCKELQDRRDKEQKEREARLRQQEKEKVKREAAKVSIAAEVSKAGGRGSSVSQHKQKTSSATSKTEMKGGSTTRIPSSKPRQITKILEGVENSEDVK